MRSLLVGLASAALLLMALWTPTPTLASGCTPTSFYRDGINLTAALINPVLVVTGSVDATGCNIGIYFGPGVTGTVSGADIHGANYFGVVSHKANVNIMNSTIHDIGEIPINGTQHGVAVYYATVDTSPTAVVCSSTGTTSGLVEGNTISSYQKGGIVANCGGTTMTIRDNTVAGLGPVPFIAQNGIQLGFGAAGEVTGNTISRNAYTGCSNQDAAQTGCIPWVSAGLLLFDVEANAVRHSRNLYRDNQFNLLLVTSQSLTPGP